MHRVEIDPSSTSDSPVCVSVAMSNRGAWIPQAQLRDDLEPRSRAEVGERVFDIRHGMWIKPLPTPENPVRPELPSVTPRSDGSRVFWRVIDERTGATLWSFEAACFETALEEKRRLCSAVGGKSGWAYLQR